jgi:DNA repair exonuclease SbcCD nuclease subunit
VHALLEHDGDRIEFADIGTTVWGRAMADHAPDNVPMHKAPNRQDHVWNIGLAHGQVVSQRAGYGSSQITHEEIRTSGFDYLALGHVHVWGDMSQGSTRAYYPGSPVAAYASVKGGHVAIATLCPERGVGVEQRRVD